MSNLDQQIVDICLSWLFVGQIRSISPEPHAAQSVDRDNIEASLCLKAEREIREVLKMLSEEDSRICLRLHEKKDRQGFRNINRSPH